MSESEQQQGTQAKKKRRASESEKKGEPAAVLFRQSIVVARELGLYLGRCPSVTTLLHVTVNVQQMSPP